MTEQMTLYNCNNCNKIYNGGKNDYDGALRENMDPTSFLCQRCGEIELGYDKEHCSSSAMAKSIVICTVTSLQTSNANIAVLLPYMLPIMVKSSTVSHASTIKWKIGLLSKLCAQVARTAL